MKTKKSQPTSLFHSHLTPLLIIAATALAVIGGAWQALRKPPALSPEQQPTGIIEAIKGEALPPEPETIHEISGKIVGIERNRLTVQIAEVRGDTHILRLIRADVTSDTALTELDATQVRAPIPGEVTAQPRTSVPLTAFHVGDTVTISSAENIKTNDQFALTAIERIKTN